MDVSVALAVAVAELCFGVSEVVLLSPQTEAETRHLLVALLPEGILSVVKFATRARHSVSVDRPENLADVALFLAYSSCLVATIDMCVVPGRST